MTNPTNNQFVLIGLPETGKTSFLAALWYVVSQANIDSGLTLDHLEGDSSYLNHIRAAWSEYRPVARNKAETENPVAMWLKNRKTGRVGRLSFPDLSGEAFRSQWTQRQLAASYEKSLCEAAGGILFVSPENINKPIGIDMVNAALGEIGGEGSKKTRIKDKPWNSEKSPTQVQLVDILQFMAGRNYFKAPFRLAVVVSAWDLVHPSDRRPGDWIKVELPLLKQFLESNQELFEASFYGVSAQGARYALPHFWAGNFNDAQPFAKKVFDHKDAISSWIWEKLDATSRATIELIQAGGKTTELQKKALAKDFNRLMAEPDVYDETRFSEVDLRPKTDNQLRNGVLQNEEKRLYLVRMLLEDAFPNELSREREYQEEAKELQQKLPSSRVIVVGDGVELSNDVTEPIQWLMR